MGYAERLAELEAEYQRVFEEIEARHGGVDYQGQLAALRAEIDKVKRQKAKFDAMRRAVESTDLREVGRLIAEEVVADPDDPQEIAASFVEDELGRYDWLANWEARKRRPADQQPLAMVQSYLQRMGYLANPEEIVNIIERMAQETPGLWK